MNILALDLWDKRVWIARAQQGIAFPLEIISRTSIIPYLKKYHKNSTLTSIVVWLPYDLYGKDERQLHKTQQFIEKLQEIFPDISIVWHDERFSSYMTEGDKFWRKDAESAQIILASYLETINISPRL